MSAQEPTEEQLREALKQLKVDDFLLQTVVTLVNLAGQKLTVEDAKDAAQAKQAIEAVRALLPLCPEEEVGPIKDALSQLQMLYVREQRTGTHSAEPSASGMDEAARERAKARSKIWTPGSE